MIEIQNLVFAYSGHAPIFNGFSLKILRGEAWAIIGPSGCGKTTLLYLLAGLIQTGRGTIRIAGKPILRPRPRTGLILQDHGLLPWATVRENARLGLKIRKYYGPDGRHAPADGRMEEKEADRRIDHWLKRLSIYDLQDHYPSQLSRGQRQRTALVRTLALEPDLLLMDEPFSALDAAIREDLHQTIHQFHAESALTYIIVTHDIEEAVYMGNRILVLGHHPDQSPRVLSNDLAGRVDYRHRPDYYDRYESLKKLIGRSP